MSIYSIIQRTPVAIAALGTLALAVSAANAAITYEANLVSPNNSGEIGWYDGTGNPNGGFTVDTENGIELGLRAKLRQSPNVINTPTDVYTVPAGLQVGSPTHAAWNYEFSIDLAPLGVSSGLNLGDIAGFTTLTITDVTTGTTNTVNPLNYWADDSGFGPTVTTPESTGQWGAQNSENPLFSDFPLDSMSYSFNPYAEHTYEFELNVANPAGGGLLASDTIFVNVPEPTSIAMLGIGALTLLRRSRRRA
jgi:hypothetical protein